MNTLFCGLGMVALAAVAATGTGAAGPAERAMVVIDECVTNRRRMARSA